MPPSPTDTTNNNNSSKKMKSLFSSNPTLQRLISDFQSLYTQTLTFELQMERMGMASSSSSMGDADQQQQQQQNTMMMEDDVEAPNATNNGADHHQQQEDSSSSSSPTSASNTSTTASPHHHTLSAPSPQVVSKMTQYFLQEHLSSESLITIMKQHLEPQMAQMTQDLYRDMTQRLRHYTESSTQELKNVLRKMRMACCNESDKVQLQEVMELVKKECRERVRLNERRVLEARGAAHQQAPSTPNGSHRRGESLSASTPQQQSSHQFTFSSEQNPLGWESPKSSLLRDKATHHAYQALQALRSENYTLALKESSAAIQIDPEYLKAYQRRATALVSMRRYAEAAKDFEKILELHPDDMVAQQKLEACRKQAKRVQYEKSVMFTPTTPSENIRLGQIFDVAIAKAEGESMGPPGGEDVGITLSFIHEMIARFREQKTIQKKYALYILVQAIKLFKKLPSVYNVDVPDGQLITICGDTHGQFFDFVRILEMNGFPSKENPYIFNGDFVDRGSWGCEIVFTLLAFKVLDPDSVHLTRGNHEDRGLNEIFGFEGEVKHKYSSEIFEIFVECFNWLPLGIVLNNRIFIVHGGVGFDRARVTIDELRQIDRFRPIPDDGLMCDLLWSDPAPVEEWDNLNERGLAPSDRGVSFFFGPDVLNRFLRENGLDLVIRSHEMCQEGFEIQMGGRLVTIFSAPNYNDVGGNKGAYIIFKGSNLNQPRESLAPKFCKFSHSPHPPVKPMAYANMLYDEEA